MHTNGPALNARASCEDVLRSLPAWFGIEDALLMYADDMLRLPTFAAVEDEGEDEGEGERIVGFVSLLEHFPNAWEIHCIAVHAATRNAGCGRALVAHAESWLIARQVSVLQVKTVAARSPSEAYRQTGEFYKRVVFQPLEVFATLWSPSNPCVQLVKFLADS